MLPADIDNVEFPTRLRGYDVEVVDNFLDRVIDAWRRDREELEADAREVAQLQRQLADAHRKLDVYTDQPTQQMPSFAIDATKILEAAQRTADDVIAEAKGQAEGIRAKAEGTAYTTVAEAREQAEGIRAKALGEVNGWQIRVGELKAQDKQLRELIISTLEEVKRKLDNP